MRALRVESRQIGLPAHKVEMGEGVRVTSSGADWQNSWEVIGRIVQRLISHRKGAGKSILAP
jgi:hypothetical protein